MMIRSKAILRHAKGQQCHLRLPGCRNERDTVVACHINAGYAGKGTGMKSHDLLTVWGCAHCHALLDQSKGRSTLSTDLLRALCETLVALWRDGLLSVPLDTAKASHERPVPKRKPKGERAPIPHRQNPWPEKGTRSIPSRPFPKRAAQEQS